MALSVDFVQVSADPEVRLLVAQAGDPGGRVLLVIHGGPDWDHTYLREPLTGLAGRHRVVFADLRGCGGSTRDLPSWAYTPDAAVADLLALLDVVGPGEVDVLGFSYGGEIAQRLVLAAPGRVRRLVIASSTAMPVPPGAYDDWPEAVAVLRGRPPSAWLGAPEPTPDLVRADAVAAVSVHVWRQAARAEYLRRMDEVRFSADWARAFVAGTLPPARPDDAPARLAALGMPVLLLQGRQDLCFPAYLAEQAAAAIPAARAVILEDAGHMAHIDQPEQWITAVVAFLGA
jgi:pimeloyl-ACP methyl ester carboxylesterase